MTDELATMLLHDPDPMVRRAAANDLCPSDGPSGKSSSDIEALVGALSDPHIAVQEAAANALLAYEPQTVSERILPLLHGNVQLRSIAVDILQQLGSASVACLLQAIDDPDPHIRKFLTDILGHIGCASSVVGLLRLLRDSCPNIRAATAEALGNIGGEDAVCGLLSAIVDEEEWVTFSVIHALGRLGAREATPLLITYLDANENAIQCAVVEALGKIGDPAVLPDLLAILPMAGLPLRHLLFVTIAGLVGERADVFQRPETREYLFAELVAALRARDPDIQWAALKGIRLMGDSNATGALLAYLGQCDTNEDLIQSEVLNALTEIGDEEQLMKAALDSEESVALQCIQALSSRRAEHAIPLLGRLVSQSGNREIRRAALVALRGLGVGDCEKAVINAINDQSGFVRSEAAKVIAQTHLESARDVLIARLDHEPYPDVILECVQALLEISPHKDPEQLEGLLTHERPEVRAAAVQFWPSVESEPVKAVLRQHLTDLHWRVRLGIVERLSSHTQDETLCDIFKGAFTDSHPHVRQAAVVGLGRYTTPDMVPILKQTLSTDSDIWVRTRCVEMLTARNEHSAAALFIELLPTAPVPLQMCLAKALGEYGETQAIQALEELQSSEAADARDAASRALEHIEERLQMAQGRA